jgi:hypothetical protein
MLITEGKENENVLYIIYSGSCNIVCADFKKTVQELVYAEDPT